MPKAVAVLCLLFGASLAYHFLDDQDEYSLTDGLWSEADEDELYKSSGRYKRSAEEETEENKVHTCCMKERSMKASCCGPYGTIRISSELQKLSMECLLEVRNRELQSFCTEENGQYHLAFGHRTRGLQQNSCVKECIAQNTSLADEEGNLMEAEVREFVQKNLTAEENLWEEGEVDKIIDNCLVQAKNFDGFKRENIKLKCNPASQIFARCLWRNLEIKCKKEEQKTKSHCEHRRRILQFEEERWHRWSCRNDSCNDVQQ